MLRNRFSVVQSQREEPWPPAKRILEDSVRFLILVLYLIQPEVSLRVCDVLNDVPGARVTKSERSMGAHGPSRGSN